MIIGLYDIIRLFIMPFTNQTIYTLQIEIILFLHCIYQSVYMHLLIFFCLYS